MSAPGLGRAGDLSGWIALGGCGDGDGPADPQFTARAQYDTERVDGVEAVIDVGADASTRDVELKDAYADKRFESGWHLRFGRGKKILGFEYEDSAAERLTLERSAIYRFMESTGLVGRDYFVSVRTERLRLAVHYDDAGDAALIPSVRQPLGAGFTWGTWGLLQRDQHRSASSSSWSVVSGLTLERGRLRGAAELFAGVDPFETELERFFGAGRTVHFAAAKLEAGVVFARFVPYARGAVLLPDVAHRGRRTLEGLVGLRVVAQEGLYLAVEVELSGTSSASRAAGLRWRSPLYRLQLRYFWS